MTMMAGDMMAGEAAATQGVLARLEEIHDRLRDLGSSAQEIGNRIGLDRPPLALSPQNHEEKPLRSIRSLLDEIECAGTRLAEELRDIGNVL